MQDILFTSYQLNDTLTLQNRIVMAPLTRCKADNDLVPTPEIAAYYARRAEAGLIISEATIIRPDGQGYPNTPGIFNAAQITGWQQVTEQVHQNNGKLFLQLWHVGRVSHPVYLKGQLPIAPSAVPLKGVLRRSPSPGLEYGVPRALGITEIPTVVQAYAQAASNAIKAGCDGVEIHGANGYLIDQFLHCHTNQRTDDYGGSPEKNVRFALEVLDAVIAQVGRDRVGLRLSPGIHVHIEEGYPQDVATFHYLLPEVDKRQIAYVHTGIFDDNTLFDYLGGTATAFLRRHYKGTVIACGGYTPEKSRQALTQKKCNLVAIGRPFIANHNYVSKVKHGEPLKNFDDSLLATLY
jgi:2,4-dienoyl-CoA reductase-like NADH-dependent reductase (Old Yellow Enzyme family)